MNHSFATIESCKMKFAVVLFAVLASAFATHPLYQPWEDFKVAHGKTYSGEEELLRFMIFADNVEKINKHNELYNKGQVSYSMGLTKFADMTHEEFKQYLSLSGKPPKRDTVNVFRAQSGVQIPDSVDWRTKGAVNGVKDQGQCGSCWAFSTVGSLESINYLQKGQLYSLSEQNLVDCSGQYGNQGCNGGSMEAGYEYIRDNGVESEDDYPYTAQDGTCQFDQSRSVLTVSGYTSVEQSEDALAQAVASVGPIAIAVDASEWQFYTGGIFSTPDFNGLDHGVVAVGYGTESGQDYWIVRNSWGPSWGESGYIRVARNDNNQIGITNDACYPNL